MQFRKQSILFLSLFYPFCKKKFVGGTHIIVEHVVTLNTIFEIVADYMLTIFAFYCSQIPF